MQIKKGDKVLIQSKEWFCNKYGIEEHQLKNLFHPDSIKYVGKIFKIKDVHSNMTNCYINDEGIYFWKQEIQKVCNQSYSIYGQKIYLRI